MLSAHSAQYRLLIVLRSLRLVFDCDEVHNDAATQLSLFFVNKTASAEVDLRAEVKQADKSEVASLRATDQTTLPSTHR